MNNHTDDQNGGPAGPAAAPRSPRPGHQPELDAGLGQWAGGPFDELWFQDQVAEAMDLIAHQGHTADPLVVIEATEMAIAHLHATQLEAMNRLAVQEPAQVDARGNQADPAPAEAAAALHWAPGTATRRFDLADELAHELPEVLAALRAGRIDLGKAQAIAEGTRWLHPLVRPRLAAEALWYAGTHTRAQLRPWLARRLAQIDPQAAQKRHQRRRRTERGVWTHDDGDGMATLTAALSAEEAQACLLALRAKTAGVQGPSDAAMADAFVAVVTGTEPGAPIPVQVIITATGPEIAGHGPISPSHADRLTDGAPVTDLATDTTGHRRLHPQPGPGPPRPSPRPALPLPRLPPTRRPMRPRPHRALPRRPHQRRPTSKPSADDITSSKPSPPGTSAS